jgi:hypothetical protein
MIPVPSGVRVWLAVGHTDDRAEELQRLTPDQVVRRCHCPGCGQAGAAGVALPQHIPS